MLKHFFSGFLAVLAVCLLLSGCSKPDVVKPETVLEQHIHAVAAGNIEAAMKSVFIPDEVKDSIAYQNQLRTLLLRDKENMDARSGLSRVTVNEVLTQFTNGTIKDGQPDFIKRTDADKGTTAIVRAQLEFNDHSFQEVIYPLKHTGEAYQIVFSEIHVQ